MARSHSSIVFVGDWFRCLPDQPGGRVQVVQSGNVAWLSRLLAPALGISGGDVRVVMPSPDGAAFARELADAELLERYHADPLGTWASLYDGELPPGCFDALFGRLGRDSLVIGFEIPPALRRRLTQQGQGYVSLHNHPLRFLKDLAFGAHTNVPEIRTSLEEIACDPREIERQAARFSARFARLDPVQARLPEGCPLLFGQTDHDASLIVEGRFAQWRDFADELAEELHDHAEVALVRHPQARWRAEVIELLRTTLGKTVIGISGNSYPLIMSGSPDRKVLTLSSSIGAEASVFGYQPRFLLADPREKFAVAGCDNPVQIMVDHRLFEQAFWEEALAGSGKGAPARAEAFYLGSNFVRGTLEGWSFTQLEGADPFADMEKTVFPASNAEDARIDEIVGTLAGTAPGDRDAAIAAAGAARIALRILPGPLQRGGTWAWGRDIAGSDLAMAEGFHPIEGDGAWSDGTAGTIEFAVGGETGSLIRIEGELAFSFFGGLLPQGPALLLYVNGKPRAALLHGEGEDPYHRLPFAADVPAGQLCRLRIESSHAASPAQLGLNSDPRQLGFILHGVEITARLPGGTGDLPALRLWGVGDRPIEVPGSDEL